MTTDFRALCAELADALDHNRQCLMDDRSLTHPLADRARAELELEAAGPSDAELWSLCMATGGDNRATDPTWPIRFARAALARYGSTPHPIPTPEAKQ